MNKNVTATGRGVSIGGNHSGIIITGNQADELKEPTGEAAAVLNALDAKPELLAKFANVWKQRNSIEFDDAWSTLQEVIKEIGATPEIRKIRMWFVNK